MNKKTKFVFLLFFPTNCFTGLWDLNKSAALALATWAETEDSTGVLGDDVGSFRSNSNEVLGTEDMLAASLGITKSQKHHRSEVE